MGVVMRVVVPLFLLGWSAFTLMFDGRVLEGLVRQSRSASYPHVPGTITHSQVKSVRVEERTQKDGEGDLVTLWCPTVVLTAPEGELRNEALVEWNDETKATALVKWLGEKVK